MNCIYLIKSLFKIPVKYCQILDFEASPTSQIKILIKIVKECKNSDLKVDGTLIINKLTGLVLLLLIGARNHYFTILFSYWVFQLPH